MEFNKFIENTTLCITCSLYPMAEMCIHSIKNFYPDLKILLSFNSPMEEDRLEKRKKYLKNFNNLSILDDMFHSRLGSHLDRFAQVVETDYFITCDDDMFFKKPGILEFIYERFKIEYYDIVGGVRGTFDHPVYLDGRHATFKAYTAFWTYFTFYSKRMFKEYDLTFQRSFNEDYYLNKYNPEKIPFYDEGCFLFSDIMKYQIPFYCFNDTEEYEFQSFFDHYEGTTLNASLGKYNENFSFSFNEIPKLKKEFFNFDILQSWQIESMLKIISNNNKLFDEKVMNRNFSNKFFRVKKSKNRG